MGALAAFWTSALAEPLTNPQTWPKGRYLRGPHRGTVALLGLAFKAGTDDVRTAPALSLARRLLAEGAIVVGYDPMAGEVALRELPDIKVLDDPYLAAQGAACVVLCTEWPEFQALDLPRLAAETATPILVDGRNYLDPAAVRAAGFTYRGVGRAAPAP